MGREAPVLWIAAYRYDLNYRTLPKPVPHAFVLGPGALILLILGFWMHCPPNIHTYTHTPSPAALLRLLRLLLQPPLRLSPVASLILTLTGGGGAAATTAVAVAAGA